MKRLRNYIILLLVAATAVNCNDMLDVSPKGILTEDQLSGPESVDGFVNAAYAFMPSVHAFSTMNPWIASLRSDDAYKGGGGIGDQIPWHEMEVFSLVTANVGNNDGVWYNGYQAISRANTAINALNRVSEDEYPLKTERLAEMHFLRGWVYFKLKRRYKWIPWVTEDDTPQEIYEISNRPDDAEDDLYLWENIYKEFKFAAENLPPTQNELGRANKYAAEAYLVETLLWMAYEQNDKHEVVNINEDRLKEALDYANDIIDNGGFELAGDFAYNFMLEYDNKSPESIWELQFSIDDGTPRGNLNEGNGLTAPWWTPHFSCCDFHKASYNMVNAFKTDPDGLPLFDTFNNSSAHNDYTSFFTNNSFDPRLGHTVAIPNLPWKYQTEVLYDSSGSRDPEIYGYFHSMKENVRTDSPGLHDEFWMFNSKNQIEVRLAEVMLWKAEILIQLERHMEALPIINEIRQRAANSTDKLIFADNSPTLDYGIGLYQAADWTPEYALEALRWERRLEFGMEGRRFYDLVRWGIAAEVMNAYFEVERNRRPWLNVARFVAGRDEFLPIPQAQMNWSQGVYKQNPGYN